MCRLSTAQDNTLPVRKISVKSLKSNPLRDGKRCQRVDLIVDLRSVDDKNTCNRCRGGKEGW